MRMNFNQVLSLMPPLHHTLPDQEFDIERSEVVAWLIAQPGFKQWVFERAKSTERIVYDGETGRWRGHPRSGKPGRKPAGSAPVLEVE